MGSANGVVGRFRRYERIGPTPILPKTATQQWGNTSTDSKPQSSLSRSVFGSDTASISEPYVTHLSSTNNKVMTEPPTKSFSITSDDGGLLSLLTERPIVTDPAGSGNSTSTTSTPDYESLGAPVTFPRITFIRSSHRTFPKGTGKSWYPTGTMPTGRTNTSFTNSSGGPIMTQTPLPTCSGTSQSDIIYETSTTTVAFTITATRNITVAPITISPLPLCQPTQTLVFLNITAAFSVSLFRPPTTAPGAPPPPPPAPTPPPVESTFPIAQLTSTIIVTKVSP